MVLKTCWCAVLVGGNTLVPLASTGFKQLSKFLAPASAHPLASLLLTVLFAALCFVAIIVSVVILPFQLLILALLTPPVLFYMVVAAYFQVNAFVSFSEWWCPEVIWRSKARTELHNRRAALTIDDVPFQNSPSSLEEILDILHQHGAKATFMVMSGFDKDGDKTSERYKALLRRAIAEGHELGNHNMFDEPAASLSPIEFEAKLKHCDALLGEIYGEEEWKARPHRWHRPGSGFWTAGMLKTAKVMGYKTVLANCFPNDIFSWTRLLNAPYLKLRARPGCIILLHDRWHTPATLREALPSLCQRLHLVTLSELNPTGGFYTYFI